MKYTETGFRAFYKQFSALKATKTVKAALKDFSGADQAQYALVYADTENVVQMIAEADKNGGLDTLIGQKFKNQDFVRLVPDIVQNGDNNFFPVFTSEEQIPEDYGRGVSRIQRHFLEAIGLAKNNKEYPEGIGWYGV